MLSSINVTTVADCAGKQASSPREYFKNKNNKVS